MNANELEALGQAIHEAGMKFDGHVTNGSHVEIMKVVTSAIEAARKDGLEQAAQIMPREEDRAAIRKLKEST